MANLNVGDKVELPGVNETYEVKSLSRLTRGNLQAVLEKDDRSRICITRNQASFKKVKAPLKKLDKFAEILAEL